MLFGERLRELRKQKDFTQRELGAKVGVDFTYISKIENGHMPPPSEKTILKLAQALDADGDELLRLAKRVPPTYRKEILKDGPVPELLSLRHSLTKKEAKALESELRELIRRWKERQEMGDEILE